MRHDLSGNLAPRLSSASSAICAPLGAVPGGEMTSQPEVDAIGMYKDSRLRLGDLADLPNVFDTLSCYDAHAAFAALGAQGVPPMYRSLVHDACALRGFKAALAQIESAQLRTTLAKALSSSVPAFWDLDAIWAGWPAAVAQAFSHEPVAPPEIVE